MRSGNCLCTRLSRLHTEFPSSWDKRSDLGPHIRQCLQTGTRQLTSLTFMINQHDQQKKAKVETRHLTHLFLGDFPSFKVNYLLGPRPIKGEQGWRSGESTRLPLMWPWFDSRNRRYMWVEFVVGSRPCSERFFSGYFVSPLSPTFPNSNSIWIIVKHFIINLWLRDIAQALPVLLTLNKLLYFALPQMSKNLETGLFNTAAFLNFWLETFKFHKPFFTEIIR